MVHRIIVSNVYTVVFVPKITEKRILIVLPYDTLKVDNFNILESLKEGTPCLGVHNFIFSVNYLLILKADLFS